MRPLSLLLSAGLLMAQTLPDSVYIRLKEQGINPYAPPPPPPGMPLPLNLPESDCPGAIRICGASYSYPGGIPTAGQTLELGTDGRGTCLLGGEHRSVWFIFTVQQSGTMGFLLCPNAAVGNDYDFAMWDVTGLQDPCSIFQGTGNVPAPIRCNFSIPNQSTCCGGISCSNNGLTGLDHTNPQAGNISYGASGPAVMPGLNVTAGQTFLLLIDNWSNNNVGFTINFYGTAQYFDNEPPRMDSVYRMCSNSYDNQLSALQRLRVRFNELIDPTTVATDGSDFTLFDLATNARIPVTAAAPVNPPQTNTVELTLGQALSPGVTYRLYINYNDPATPGGPSGGTNNNPIADQCGIYLDTLNIPPGAAADTFDFVVLDTMQIQVLTSSPTCTGTNTGQITAQISGGGRPPYQYVLITGTSAAPPTSGWSPANTWTNRGAGTYTVWIRDAMGCVQRRIVQLQDPPPLGLQLVDSLLLACGGQPTGFVVLQGVGGTPPYEYSLLPVAPVWTPNNTFSGLGTGNYTLRVRDNAGCVATRTVSVSVGSPIDLQLQQITPILCHGGTGGITVEATGSSNFTYTLLPLNITNTTGVFTNLPAGTYEIRAVEPLGCFDTVMVDLAEPDPFAIADSVLRPATCRTGADGEIQVTITGGTPPYTYTWRDSAGNILPAQGNSLTDLRPGTYSLSLTDDNGCTFGPLSWEVGYLYDATLRNITTEIEGDCPGDRIVRIRVDAQGVDPLLYKWIWSDGVRDSSAQPVSERAFSQLEGGEFNVQVELISGGSCIAEGTQRISIPVCSGLIIPNTLTPNGDGINDIWNIQAPGFQRYIVIVHDRWGGEVWTNGGDMSRLWDGRNKAGQTVPEGTYIYLFTGTDGNGKEVRRSGTVTVLR